MRDILFRGKTVPNGEWVEGYYIKRVFGGTNIHDIYRSQGTTAIDPTTLGQFVELTDKNGKKIFEGDIVRVIIVSHWRNNEIISDTNCPILFQDGMFGVIHGNRDEFKHFQSFSYNTSFEIIGTIHDKLTDKE